MDLTPDAAKDSFAKALAAVVRGQQVIDQITEIGGIMKARYGGIRARLVDLADRADAIATETDLTVRKYAALTALGRAEKAPAPSPEHRDAVTKAGALRDALMAAKGIDDKLVAVVRLEAVLAKAGIPLVHREDGHLHDNLDDAFGDKGARMARFRSFVARFLAATKSHDFIPNPVERQKHSELQAAIWRARHANAGDFDARLAECQRQLTDLCETAGIPEPRDADLSPEALIALFHPEPDEIATGEDRTDAIWHRTAPVLWRFTQLGIRASAALDAADQSDEGQRQIAADLQDALRTARHTDDLPTMERSMAEAERHLAALTGQDVPEQGEDDTDGPLY